MGGNCYICEVCSEPFDSDYGICDFPIQGLETVWDVCRDMEGYCARLVRAMTRLVPELEEQQVWFAENKQITRCFRGLKALQEWTGSDEFKNADRESAFAFAVSEEPASEYPASFFQLMEDDPSALHTDARLFERVAAAVYYNCHPLNVLWIDGARKVFRAFEVHPGKKVADAVAAFVEQHQLVGVGFITDSFVIEGDGQTLDSNHFHLLQNQGSECSYGMSGWLPLETLIHNWRHGDYLTSETENVEWELTPDLVAWYMRKQQQLVEQAFGKGREIAAAAHNPHRELRRKRLITSEQEDGDDDGPEVDGDGSSSDDSSSSDDNGSDDGDSSDSDESNSVAGDALEGIRSSTHGCKRVRLNPPDSSSSGDGMDASIPRP
jgi:hypothetical protein